MQDIHNLMNEYNSGVKGSLDSMKAKLNNRINLLNTVLPRDNKLDPMVRLQPTKKDKNKKISRVDYKSSDRWQIYAIISSIL